MVHFIWIEPKQQNLCRRSFIIIQQKMTSVVKDGKKLVFTGC